MGADERRWQTDRGPTRTELRKQCDKLAGEIVHARGRCQRCGAWGSESTPLQAAHLVPRRYSATRCSLSNLALCCVPCHTLIDAEPWWKLDLTLKLLGDDGFWDLIETAELPVKANAEFWRATLVGLKQAAKDRRTPTGGDAA